MGLQKGWSFYLLLFLQKCHSCILWTVLCFFQRIFRLNIFRWLASHALQCILDFVALYFHIHLWSSKPTFLLILYRTLTLITPWIHQFYMLQVQNTTILILKSFGNGCYKLSFTDGSVISSQFLVIEEYKILMETELIIGLFLAFLLLSVYI